MKSKEEFTRLIDKEFYRHLNSKSLIPFNESRNRLEYLSFVYDSLLSNILNYKPKKPRAWISFPKTICVIRMVPTFEMDDYCIYYYCLKVLEDYIAKNRVAGTFGGFALGGKICSKEWEEIKQIEPAFTDSVNENSYNAFKWRFEYSRYWSKLREFAKKMDNEYKYAIQFDIANFYDCINLNRLKYKIKNEIGNNLHSDELYLLFRFLEFYGGGSKRTVGIPQDEVGDCSRILANFFLQDYDQFIFDECNKRGAGYLRYADDQIIFANSKDDAEELMYFASEKLFKEGLNVNAGKVKNYNNFQAINDYYCFDIFEKLFFDDQDINSAFDLFVFKKEKNIDFRESTVLKRMLHKKIDLTKMSHQRRIKLISYLWDDNFLLFTNDHFMRQIYFMLRDREEKAEFLETLKNLSKKTKFNYYKYQLRRFIDILKLTDNLF